MLRLKTVVIVSLFFIAGCSSSVGSKNSSLPDDFTDKMVNAGVTSWHFTKKDMLLDEGKIVFTSRINELASKEIISKLLYLDGKVGVIDLYLRTTGGWMNDAFSIIDVMRSMRTPVNVHAMGLCESAGVMILLGATGKRYASANSDIVLHFNRDDSDDIYSAEKINRERFEQLYRTRSRIPNDWYPLTGNRQLHLTAKEALSLGIIDEIK